MERLRINWQGRVMTGDALFCHTGGDCGGGPTARLMAGVLAGPSDMLTTVTAGRSSRIERAGLLALKVMVDPETASGEAD